MQSDSQSVHVWEREGCGGWRGEKGGGGGRGRGGERGGEGGRGREREREEKVVNIVHRTTQCQALLVTCPNPANLFCCLVCPQASQQNLPDKDALVQKNCLQDQEMSLADTII